LPLRLEPGSYVVGRTKRAQIVIVDATVSRRHACLFCTPSGLTLEDLGSSNGTWVNERLVSSSCDLRVGDHIRFGYVVCALSSSPLLVRASDENESTYHVRQQAAKTVRIDSLTAAQLAVVNHVLAGRTEAEIASLLDKSPHTIHTHLKAVFQRLQVHSRAELIVKVMQRD
jgi:DNA-binding CsgD family transcriptional regulator